MDLCVILRTWMKVSAVICALNCSLLLWVFHASSNRIGGGMDDNIWSAVVKAQTFDNPAVDQPLLPAAVEIYLDAPLFCKVTLFHSEAGGSFAFNFIGSITKHTQAMAFLYLSGGSVIIWELCSQLISKCQGILQPSSKGRRWSQRHAQQAGV